MSEVLQANIFFLIASIATVVFCLLVTIILYQVLKVVKCIRRVVERIEMGSEQIAEDYSTLRSSLTQGSVVARVFSFFMPKKKTYRGRRKTKHDLEVDEL